MAATVLYAEQDGKLWDKKEAKAIIQHEVGIQQTVTITLFDTTGMLLGGSTGASCVRQP